MKKLPIKFPYIETYQGTAFVMGIILANSHMENLIYNEYINVSAIPSSKLSDLDFIFDKVLWDGIEKYGIEIYLYYSKNQSKDFFCSFLEERLDQDCYLLFYSINEYYLSHTPNYKKRHLTHDIYVYGYTDTSFLVMGYKDNKLQMFELPKQEIIDAFYDIKEDDKRHFCTMRISKLANVHINYSEIYNQIKNYYYNCSLYNDERIHGIEVIPLIKRCLCKYIDSDILKTIDLRPFRLLYEHKKMMSLRIKKIAEEYPIKIESIQQIDEIERKSKKLFMLSIKYNVSLSNEIIKKMISLLDEIYIDEMQFANKLFEYWNLK